MQAADLPNGDYLVLQRQFHLAWRWRVAVQRKMTSGIVIVVEVRGQDVVQMPFVEHDDMIQTIAAYAADNSFAIRILPGHIRKLTSCRCVRR